MRFQKDLHWQEQQERKSITANLGQVWSESGLGVVGLGLVWEMLRCLSCSMQLGGLATWRYMQNSLQSSRARLIDNAKD